jgi:signal transduction histidine kinase
MEEYFDGLVQVLCDSQAGVYFAMMENTSMPAARQYVAARFRGIERRFVRILIAGFSLVLVAMVVSGVIALRAVGRIDDATNDLTARFLRETSLIEQLARQQANLGMLLYAMADERTPPGLQRLGQEFQREREQTRRVLDEAMSEKWLQPEAAAWLAVRQAAEPLFDEIHSLVIRQQNNSPDLSRLYHGFTTAMERLMEVSYRDAASSRTAQLTIDAGVLQAARNLFLVAVALAGICATAAVAGSITSFQRLEKQAAALAQLSLHTLAQQEESARRFSQEMHDEFGQALNAIGSTLSVVRAKDEESAERLLDAGALVREAQSMARDLSQLLRPRILDDFGLDAGLRELARSYSQRTGIVVDYRSQIRERLAPLAETHLFRIAQEALTNTSRHTLASSVNIVLERDDATLRLTVSDNGGGFVSSVPDHSGLGLLGMQERAQSLGGQLTVNSRAGEGLTICAVVPDKGLANGASA